MSGGSQQLRLYRMARADGAEREEAASFAGIAVSEAALHDADDARNPPSPDDCAVPKAMLPLFRVVGDAALLTALCGAGGRA